MKKFASVSALAALFLVLSLGLLRAAFYPKEINSYESRPANQLPELSFSQFLSGGFQQSFESALSDQIPFSQHMKKAYNELSSAWIKLTLQPILANNPDVLVEYNDTRIYRGYMLYDRKNMEDVKPLYELVMGSYNNAMQANKDTRFSFYYVESDTTCDVVSGEKNDSFEYLRQISKASEQNFGRLQIDSFLDFSRYFRQTDHHWNHEGSYRAYADIIRMLGMEAETLQPAAEEMVDSSYVGTKGVGARLPAFAEQAYVYYFDYPPLGAQYGSEQLYRSGELTEFTYGSFYGPDDAEFIFDTGRPEHDNLLVLGDSFDNAILKLLASHFNRTHCVDLRYYEGNDADEGLNISKYIREHDIDQVLVIGSDFLYSDPTFMVRS